MTEDLQLLEEAISKLLGEIEVDLVDIEHRQGVLCVTVSRLDGLDLESLTRASRSLSDFLDLHEELAPKGSYELEVSSPGLERRLRRPAHFANALGQVIAVRTTPGATGPRRLEGVLGSADAKGIAVMPTGEHAERTLTYGEIDRAHTVFDWKAALAAEKRDRAAGEDLHTETPLAGERSGADHATKVSRESTRR